MRKLMWFSIGFAAACAAGAYLFNEFWIITLSIMCIITALAIGFVFHKPIPMVLAVGLAVGLLYFCVYNEIYLQTARNSHGESVNTTVTITDYSNVTQYGVAADGVVRLGNSEYKVKLYYNECVQLKPGDVLTGDFNLRFTAGGSHRASYHRGEGIFLLVYAEESVTVWHNNKENEMKYFVSRLRKSILSLMDSMFSEDVVAFARALILGDTTHLTYEQDSAFKVSGIRHVIAVSGLHVSILFTLVYILSGKKRVLTAIFGIPALLLFAALAGFTPSITRACIMQCLMIFALLFNREYDPPTALAFAVIVMLTVNPLAVTSVSLQLSVGCMIGIFLFSRKIYQYFSKKIPADKKKTLTGRFVGFVAASVSVTFGAMSITTPLSAYYFGMVSVVGVLTNLIGLWVVSFVFYGIMLACAAGFIWLPAGQTAASIVAWLIRYVQGVADIMAKPVFAAVYVNSIYILLWLVFSYALFVAFLLSKKKNTMLFAGLCLAGLAISIGFSYLEPKLDNYRVTVLDVGQGQSILVQSEGKCYLVDCGGDSAVMAADTAAQALLSQGVDHLDGVILTHYDIDHAAGVPLLLARIKTDKLYLPDVADDGTIKESLRSVYSDKISWISEIETREVDNFKFTLIPSGKGKSGNESGMCILFQIENCDILITGDRTSTGERELLEQIQLPELELLVVGHHGAPDSTGFALLEQTRPKSAAISVGAGNSYGHPSSEVLDKLELFGTNVRRTDLDGTIIYRG